MKTKFVFCWLSVFLMTQVNAGYYEEGITGWHWYNEPPPEEAALKEDDLLSSASATQIVQALRAVTSDALNTAILKPTTQNIARYIQLQQFLTDKSSLFAQLWQKALLENPELDFSIHHPTVSAALPTVAAEHHKAVQAAIEHLSNHSGLFFFYQGKDPLSQQFAPLARIFHEGLKNFSQDANNVSND